MDFGILSTDRYLFDGEFTSRVHIVAKIDFTKGTCKDFNSILITPVRMVTVPELTTQFPIGRRLRRYLMMRTKWRESSGCIWAKTHVMPETQGQPTHSNVNFLETSNYSYSVCCSRWHWRMMLCAARKMYLSKAIESVKEKKQTKPTGEWAFR